MTRDLQLSLRDILHVEDTPDLLEIRCEKTDIPLWPLIRNVFLRAIISDLVYHNRLDQLGAATRPSMRAAVTLARGALHNFTHDMAVPGGICIMASGMGLQRKDGRFLNRLSDHFALASPGNTCLVEERFDWNWPFPRHFDRVLLHAPYQAFCELAGLVTSGSRHARLARQVIDIVSHRAREGFGWSLNEPQQDAMVLGLARRAAAVPFAYATYRRLLRKVGAQLLLKEEACYGRSAVAVAAAKSLGIHVAEYQHGAIIGGHDAYNFAPAMAAADSFRRCLPDCILTYGNWWGEQGNVPARKVVVGNPHRTFASSDTKGALSKNEILLLGDGVDTHLYIKLAENLQALVKPLQLKVVFRPHPFERAKVDADPALRQTVEIDKRTDVYQSLAHAECVIGEASTALFEAVGLVKKILVWETPKSRFNMPEHPFKGISNAEEIATALEGDFAMGVPVDVIWADNWRENYHSFLADRGIVVSGS